MDGTATPPLDPTNPNYKQEFEARLSKEGRGPRIGIAQNSKVIVLQEEGLYLTVELTLQYYKFKIDDFRFPKSPLCTFTIRLDNPQKLISSHVAKPIRDAYKAIYYENASAYLYQTIQIIEENVTLFENFEAEPEYTAKTESKADRLILLVQKQNPRLFKDQFNEPYAYIPVKISIKSEASEPSEATALLIPPRHVKDLEVNISPRGNLYGDSSTSFTSSTTYQIWPVKSTFFQQWMAHLMWEADGTAPKKDHINSAIAVLSHMASENEVIDLYNRVAPDGNGGFWLDMTNEQWEAIHVTKDGWGVTQPPIIFRRYTHQAPLCKPEHGGDLTKFFKYINIGDKADSIRNVDQQLLYLVTLLASYIPKIPHVGVTIFGGPGHIKTFTQVISRKTIDPSSTIYNAIPGSGKYVSLIQILTQHYYTVWDNVSEIDQDTSDSFCRAITGAAFQLRKLFTDDETFLRAFQRCVNINGINVPGDAPDFLDRQIVFEAPYIPEDKRKPETQIYAEFDGDAPSILGGFLDVLVKAVVVYPTLKIDRLPRMADYALWGCAISEALGVPYQKFLNAYRMNILESKGNVVKSRIIGQLLIDILNFDMPTPNKTVPNPPTEKRYLVKALHRDIMGAAKANSININTLPPDPTRLAKELNIITPNLPSLGFYATKKATNSGTEYTFSRLKNITLDHLSERAESYKNTWNGGDLKEVLQNNSDNPSPTEGKPEAEAEGEGPKVMPRPKRFLEQLRVMLETIQELSIKEAVKDDDLYDVYGAEWGLVSRPEFDKLMGVLAKDGVIYYPRPQYVKATHPPSREVGLKSNGGEEAEI